MHQRQAIREAVVAALLNQTAAGAHVYESRMAPLNKHELPSIIVYTESEAVTEDSKSTAPRELDRRLVLAIEVAVRASEDVDDDLDDLAVQIEKALHLDPTLGDKVSDLILASTEIELFEESKGRIGAMKLLYNVRYFTYAPEADDVTLDAFETADIKTNLGNSQHADDQAHDVVEPEQ